MLISEKKRSALTDPVEMEQFNMFSLLSQSLMDLQVILVI